MKTPDRRGEWRSGSSVWTLGPGRIKSESRRSITHNGTGVKRYHNVVKKTGSCAFSRRFGIQRSNKKNVWPTAFCDQWFRNVSSVRRYICISSDRSTHRSVSRRLIGCRLTVPQYGAAGLDRRSIVNPPPSNVTTTFFETPTIKLTCAVWLIVVIGRSVVYSAQRHVWCIRVLAECHENVSDSRVHTGRFSWRLGRTIVDKNEERDVEILLRSIVFILYFHTCTSIRPS